MTSIMVPDGLVHSGYGIVGKDSCYTNASSFDILRYCLWGAGIVLDIQGRDRIISPHTVGRWSFCNYCNGVLLPPQQSHIFNFTFPDPYTPVINRIALLVIDNPFAMAISGGFEIFVVTRNIKLSILLNTTCDDLRINNIFILLLLSRSYQKLTCLDWVYRMSTIVSIALV